MSDVRIARWRRAVVTVQSSLCFPGMASDSRRSSGARSQRAPITGSYNHARCVHHQRQRAPCRHAGHWLSRDRGAIETVRLRDLSRDDELRGPGSRPRRRCGHEGDTPPLPVGRRGSLPRERHLRDDGAHPRVWRALRLPAPCSCRSSGSSPSPCIAGSSPTRRCPTSSRAVLSGAGVSEYELRLIGSYKPQEHVCQYRESDFDFISRWMEREGLYYYFEQGDGGETLIITGRQGVHAPARPEGGPVCPAVQRAQGQGRAALDLHVPAHVDAVQGPHERLRLQQSRDRDLRQGARRGERARRDQRPRRALLHRRPRAAASRP